MGIYHKKEGNDRPTIQSRQKGNTAILNRIDGNVLVAGIADCNYRRSYGERILHKIADYIICNQAEMFPTEEPDRKLNKKFSVDVANISQYSISSETLSALISDCARELSNAHRLAPDIVESTLLIFAFHQKSGQYYTIHLGDGCLLGVKKNHRTIIISPPNEGTLPFYTWHTASCPELLQPHVEINTGNIRQYRRLFLLNNETDSICNGKDIPPSTQHLIAEKRISEILDYVEINDVSEKASVMIIDLV